MGKFKFSYKRFAVTVMVGAILAATTATAAFSYAWFTNHNNVTDNDLHGSTAGAYFARGDGSSTNPYVINKPIHLYNLAWLQYIGAFKDASGTDKEPYFLIESNLNMAGWTLPPIGTETNPFMGHLDGFQKKVENLTISNSFAAYNGKHPAAVTKDNFQTLNITGLFGVIEQPTKDTTTPSLQNLYVDKLTVSSTTKQTLTGLVAGYVNGKIDGVGINDSKLDLASGTTATSYKNTTFNNISKYTSVGYCTENFETSYVKTNTTMYKPAQAGMASFNPTGGGGGTENDWGGSIDILSLSKRVSYITQAIGTSDSSHTFSSPLFNLKTGKSRDYKSPYDWDGTDVTSAMMFEGTYLPLNISNTIDLSFYKSKKPEEISATNTGYLVGGGSTWSNSTTRLRNQQTGSNIEKGIYKSFGSFSNNREDVFGGSNFSLFYYDSKVGKHYRIRDEENKTTQFTSTLDNEADKNVQDLNLHGYKSVKSNFLKTLDEVTNDTLLAKSNINVPSLLLRFQNKLELGECKSTINGKTYGSYQFYKGGINFTLKQDGRVSFIVGVYDTTNTDLSYFAELYSLSREQTGSIKTGETKKITGVSENNGTIGYRYSNSVDSDYDSSKLVFDINALNSAAQLQKYGAYFIEIPLRAGDYFLKSLEKTSDVPYILYLDIGANAGGTTGNKVDRTKIYEVFEQVNEEFKYPNGVEIVNFADGGVDAKKFAVVVGTSYSGQVALKYDGNSASFTVNASTDTGTGLGYYEAGLNFTSGSTTQVGATITHTRTQRLTYFDFYRAADKGAQTVALYTNVLRFYKTHTIDANGNATDIETKRLPDFGFGQDDTEWTMLGENKLKIYDEETGNPTDTLPEITEPDSFNENIKVFTLQTADPTVQSIDADWIQTGLYSDEGNPVHHTFKPNGYKFTMKDSAGTALEPSQYFATINENYTVSINA